MRGVYGRLAYTRLSGSFVNSEKVVCFIFLFLMVSTEAGATLPPPSLLRDGLDLLRLWQYESRFSFVLLLSATFRRFDGTNIKGVAIAGQNFRLELVYSFKYGRPNILCTSHQQLATNAFFPSFSHV